MALEIERKFLIPSLPDNISQFSHADIMQWYFFNEWEKLVRLRKKGNQYFQTIKTGDGLIREEDEEDLSQAIFDEEWNNVENRYLEKTRYEIPYQWTMIELDIYRWKLEWLMVTEIEFISEAEAKAFVVPERFGRELTGVQEATNEYLAKYGLSENLRVWGILLLCHSETKWGIL